MQANDLLNSLGSIWHYEMLTIDENEIAVGNLFTAIIACLLLLRASRKFSAYAAKLLEIKYNCSKASASAAQKGVFYTINVFAIILTMQVAHIPVSSLAFIGGSLAIAIGLGAQNLIGNFISSVIIIFEQPIKVGDTIEVEGISGQVHAINSRCTILETIKGSKVLIPNSIIMQKTLTNWTLEHPSLSDFITLKIQRRKEKNISHYTAIVDKELEVIPEITASSILVDSVDDNELALSIKLRYSYESDMSYKIIKHKLILGLDKSFYGVSYRVC